ncbi:hypothetical protein PSEUBRA_000346 [Kalmanozyma brasiliensis GHG001]|uniref:uncharacterized protein n=1 Tax=Kalmanozyma brasiliensis (strain GHG001) TaxID=1365824 RepID=UPI002867C186|nr:uncharacterized protein PSEUBRA_000346 [Kalmanozyma brasiliensis GHG001]KAF6766804.1 hypothetical protein PSEUBRA_000346 [Kalmanozyma brasiliensis GHG001]
MLQHPLSMQLEHPIANMTAPWAWTLDTASSSSTLAGPSSSSAFVSTDPLSSLSNTSVERTATDEIFWQDFRPKRCPIKVARREKKRARLSRFDSDDGEHVDVDAGVKTEEDELATSADAAEAGESEEDEASGAGQTSSEGSVTNDDTEDLPPSSVTEIKIEDEVTDTKDSPSIGAACKQTRQTQPEAAAYATHLIARAIHRHALLDGEADIAASAVTHDSPSPLTYKETVRLVRLVAMIFRFPKSSRRIVRRRRPRPSDSNPDSTLDSSTASASTSAASTSTSIIELKPKYVSSTSRKPRILAKIHPDDALPHSAAVLKLIALIPAALPSRVGCVDWIVDIAVQARRDEYGNILLPNSAYECGTGRGESEDTEIGNVTIKKEDEEEQEGKVTRSRRLRAGTSGLALARAVDAEADLKAEEQDAVATPDTSLAVEEQVDSHTSTPMDSSDAAPFSSPLSSAIAPPDESAPRKPKLNNLSKLLAERMREKREAKTLLLRTHQSLRKKRSVDAEDDSVSREEAGVVAAEEDEGDDMDTETLANTIANSARVNARAAILGEDGGGVRDLAGGEGDVTIKQEDV